MNLDPDMRQLINSFLSWFGGLASALLIVFVQKKRSKNEEEESHVKIIETQDRTLSAAWDKIERLENRITELNEKHEKELKYYKDQNTALWSYVIKLAEGYNSADMKLPDPPDKIKSDPKILNLKGKVK